MRPQEVGSLVLYDFFWRGRGLLYVLVFIKRLPSVIARGFLENPSAISLCASYDVFPLRNGKVLVAIKDYRRTLLMDKILHQFIQYICSIYHVSHSLSWLKHLNWCRMLFINQMWFTNVLELTKCSFYISINGVSGQIGFKFDLWP